METTIKSISHKTYTEYYFSFPRESKNSVSKKALKKLLDNLNKNKIYVLKVVLHGNSARSQEYLPLLEPYPSLIVGDSASFKIKGKYSNRCGILIYAISGRGKVKYIRKNKKTIGSLFDLGDNKFLIFSGPNNGKRNFSKFKDETSLNYKIIEKVLKRNGFAFSNIYRFWNHIVSIFENYLPFNEVRDAYFKKHKITDYPAATGIEADLIKNRKINIGFEAWKGARQIEVNNVCSDFQCEASKYKKRFSRAKLLDFKENGIKKIYISGTSSVDKAGNSVFQNNPEKNIKYTMSCVENLLLKNGMSLNNIVASVAYFKKQKMIENFKKQYVSKKWNFPYDFIYTNVCRDSFIFEFECIAVNESSNIDFENIAKIKKPPMLS